MIFVPIELATRWKPKVVIVENVVGILGDKDDVNPPIDTVVGRLDDAGYDVRYGILKACDFGLPQVRRRVFIVGFRRDLHVQNFRLPEPVGYWR